MINIAVIGVGYWGPNLVRNFASLGAAVRVAVLCDQDTERVQRIRQQFCPDARIVKDIADVSGDAAIDACVIATPIRTHFDIGRRMLEAGKHVFVEKPLAESVRQCRTLIELAQKKQRVLMVGHVFEYNAVVRWIKEYIEKDEFGNLLYLYSRRVNLGRIQNDINALWSFAPHDVSIVNYWLDSEPVEVSARGFSYLNPDIEDVVFVTLRYPGDIGVHMHLGWLDPLKVRQMTLVGSRKMIVYDDVSMDEKIRIYDKGVENLGDAIESPESFAKFNFQVRVGDIQIPKMTFSEPLRTECEHFIRCITDGKRPVTDGENGLRVVRVLEKAEESIKNDGRIIRL